MLLAIVGITVFVGVLVALLGYCTHTLNAQSQRSESERFDRSLLIKEAGGDYVILQKALEAASFEVEEGGDAPLDQVIHHIRRLRLKA